uniref:SFRICE_024842 n=1 Tax=Spodoptera frugiperda TaxID=7108 RepID=A0A2H1VE05_SPOFR
MFPLLLFELEPRKPRECLLSVQTAGDSHNSLPRYLYKEQLLQHAPGKYNYAQSALSQIVRK